MIRKSNECPRCGSWKRGAHEQCVGCDERDERLALEERPEVFDLNNCETVEELREWIKENLLR